MEKYSFIRVYFGWRGHCGSASVTAACNPFELELELELIQTHMAQKPLLWVKVGAHAVRNRSKCGGVGWAGAGVAWRLGVCVVFEAIWALFHEYKVCFFSISRFNLHYF